MKVVENQDLSCQCSLDLFVAWQSHFCSIYRWKAAAYAAPAADSAPKGPKLLAMA